jgi:hypothetical protein
VGVVFVALIALVALPYFALLTVIFLAGTTGVTSTTRCVRALAHGPGSGQEGFAVSRRGEQPGGDRLRRRRALAQLVLR